MISSAFDSGFIAALLCLVVTAAPILLYALYAQPKPHPGIPVAGFDDGASFSDLNEARKKWLEDAPSIMERALKKVIAPLRASAALR